MSLFKNTNLKNQELVFIYKFLTREIDRADLTYLLKKSKTNTYYYIGRATTFWLKKGILRFKKIKDVTELGGSDL